MSARPATTRALREAVAPPPEGTPPALVLWRHPWTGETRLYLDHPGGACWIEPTDERRPGRPDWRFCAEGPCAVAGPSPSVDRATADRLARFRFADLLRAAGSPVEPR